MDRMRLDPFDQSEFQKLLAPATLGVAYIHPDCPHDREIEIGDVGFFQNNGQFVILFNVLETSNSEIPSYKPLSIPNHLIAHVNPFLQPGHVIKVTVLR